MRFLDHEFPRQWLRASLDAGVGGNYPEEKTINPITFTLQSFVVHPDYPLSQEIAAQLTLFKHREVIYAQSIDVSDPGKERVLYAAMTNTQATGDFMRATSNGYSGIIVVASDTSGIVGYAAVEIDRKRSKEDQIITNSVGISTEPEYQGRHLGLTLLAMRDAIVLQEGYAEYVLSGWDKSITLYRKLGLSFEPLPSIADNPNAKRIHVQLSAESVYSACAIAGIDPQRRVQQITLAQKINSK